MLKKVLKIIGIIIASLLMLAMIAYGALYYNFFGKYEADETKYPHSVGYIDQSIALLNDVYTLCDLEAHYDLHSPRHLRVYEGSKKDFRKNILETYDNKNHDDSGYITYRFIVNCKGQPGWFNILQTDLNYETTELNQQLADTLLSITAKPKHWKIRIVNDQPVDYYMYVTYRLEDGKITEILP